MIIILYILYHIFRVKPVDAALNSVLCLSAYMNIFLERFGLTNSLCAVRDFSSNLFLVFYTTGPSEMEKKTRNNSSSALN